jgi:acetyltransferase-like isoleucine patch superfamily enzyme
VELGRGTLVGVGAVVIASHAGGATLVGVPARPRGEST